MALSTPVGLCMMPCGGCINESYTQCTYTSTAYHGSDACKISPLTLQVHVYLLVVGLRFTSDKDINVYIGLGTVHFPEIHQNEVFMYLVMEKCDSVQTRNFASGARVEPEIRIHCWLWITICRS